MLRNRRKREVTRAGGIFISCKIHHQDVIPEKTPPSGGAFPLVSLQFFLLYAVTSIPVKNWKLIESVLDWGPSVSSLLVVY